MFASLLTWLLTLQPAYAVDPCGNYYHLLDRALVGELTESQVRCIDRQLAMGINPISRSRLSRMVIFDQLIKDSDDEQFKEARKRRLLERKTEDYVISQRCFRVTIEPHSRVEVECPTDIGAEQLHHFLLRPVDVPEPEHHDTDERSDDTDAIDILAPELRDDFDDGREIATQTSD
jgi:hypothetical protein